MFCNRSPMKFEAIIVNVFFLQNFPLTVLAFLQNIFFAISPKQPFRSWLLDFYVIQIADILELSIVV